MDTPLRALIERIFAAVEAKDLEAALQCVAEEAVFINPHYPSPAMIGKAVGQKARDETPGTGLLIDILLVT